MKTLRRPVVVRALLLACLLVLAATSGQAQVNCAGVSAWTDCCSCSYKAGQLATFNGTLYHAAQTFTNTCEAGWKPSLAPSLWTLNGTCVAASPAAMPRGHTNNPMPPAATATPQPTPTSVAPLTPLPTSTATPSGVKIAVQGSRSCDGMQQFLMLQWNTAPPHLGSSDYKIGFSASPGGPYTPKLLGAQTGSVITTIGLDSLPGCTGIDNACVGYVAVSTGGAYSQGVRGEMIAPACSSPPAPLPPAGPMPGPPKGVFATPGTDTCDGFFKSIVLSWRPLPGAKYYNVYRAEPGTNTFEPLAWYIPATSYAVPVRGAADFVVYALNGTEMTAGTRVLGKWTTTTCPAPTPATPGWRPGITYFIGTVVMHADGNYKCLQTHQSQLGWEPPNAPTLWSKQ
jgi:hypothetical protein